MSNDISVPLAEALLEFERDNALAYIASVLREDPTPEFRKWLAVQIEEGRIILAPAGKGRPVDTLGEVKIMNAIAFDERFDRRVKMQAMIAALKEQYPDIGRDKARDLINAALDQREASEDAQRDSRK